MKKIFEKQSKFQKIEVFEDSDLGKVLKLNETTVLSSKDAFIANEMMAHVAVCTHREPKNVLILGGGIGGSAKEVLRHSDLSVDLVEIDEEIVNVSKEYFKEYSEIWENRNLNLKIQNALVFIQDAKESSYDIVLLDAVDEKVFDFEFYAQIKRILKDDGLMVSQGGSWWVDMDSHKSMLKSIGNHFGIVMPYRYEMYSYEGTNWNYILASKKYHPTADIILQRADLIDGLNYYNSDIQLSSFTLPTYVDKELRGIAKK
jgi:spermidine synthase